MEKIPETNDYVKSFGQTVKVIEIDLNNKIYYLDHPIVVPTIEYTRDYIYFNEIEEILWK